MAGLYTTDYTEEQFRAMAGFLREAMEAGFIGLSTGLEFYPGTMSRPEEVERLAAIVAEYDGVPRELTDAELYLGRDIGSEESDEYLNEFLARTAAKLRVQIEGRKKGGLDAGREEALLTEVFAIAKARGFDIR